MERKTKAQDLSKSQKTLNKTYKLGSLFDKSDKKTELKKTYTREDDSEPSGGITQKKDYVTTKQVDNTAVINQAVKDEKTTESIPAFRVDYTSRKISEAKVYNSTDTALNMTTKLVGTETTKLSSVIDHVASIVSAANKTTADSRRTTTFQAIEPSSVINKVTSDPASVITTTKNTTTVAFNVMTSAEVQATTVKTNLSRIGNDVTYESDVYIKTSSTTNATTNPKTTEISSVNDNVTSYPFTGLYDTTSMTAVKPTSPNMTSFVNNVTKDPDSTKLASSTTATSAVTFTDAVNTTQTTELLINNNITNYTDSVSIDVTSKTTDIPSAVTPIKYFFVGGGVVTLFFALLMIYFACMRSNKRRKFELRKKQRENKNVVGLEMGVYEEFKKSFYEKRPFDIEEVDFAENVTEVTVVWKLFLYKNAQIIWWTSNK